MMVGAPISTQFEQQIVLVAEEVVAHELSPLRLRHYVVKEEGLLVGTGVQVLAFGSLEHRLGGE
jgi:hypothetical protein